MEDLIERVRKNLEPDLGSAEQEWELLTDLLKGTTTYRYDIFKWVFIEHQGYTRTRAWAGREVFQANAEEGWKAISHLLSSKDPDDRETALMTIKTFNDPRVPLIIKPLLYDPWPYIQFAAAEILKDIYPEEVKSVMQALQTHEEQWVRDSAEAMLKDMA